MRTSGSKVTHDLGFTADLIPLTQGRYKIRYNARQLPIIQMIQIYHELAEYKAFQSHPGLFDDDPGLSTYAYTGAHAPQDFRHAAVVECERLLVARLQAAGYHVPRSVLRGRTDYHSD